MSLTVCNFSFYLNVKSVLYHANVTHYIISAGSYSFCKVTDILSVRVKLNKCYFNDEVKEDGHL
jgi:hypothetical protein